AVELFTSGQQRRLAQRTPGHLLRFPPWPLISRAMEKGSRIVVAMSGGVDSSVTAALLKRQGHDVIGITLQLYPDTIQKKKGACCAGQDIYDAKRVAETLAIPHYVLDYQSRFASNVIAEFADAYARGETPIP